MTIVDVVGYVGAGSMMLCLAPQLIKTIRDGHADGIALGYLILAMLGMTCLLTYVSFTSRSIPLILNYLINGMGFGVILKYKIAPVAKR